MHNGIPLNDVTGGFPIRHAKSPVNACVKLAVWPPVTSCKVSPLSCLQLTQYTVPKVGVDMISADSS